MIAATLLYEFLICDFLDLNQLNACRDERMLVGRLC